MDLLEKLLRGIYSYDFEQPTALQQRATKLCILPLILASTRELTQQIQEVVLALGKYMSVTGVTHHVCIAGTYVGVNMKRLEAGVRIFVEQIHDVIEIMPQNTQILFLSATFPSNALEVTTKYMKDPIKIVVTEKELTLEGVRQLYVTVSREEESKFDELVDLYEMIAVQCIIFCNTRRKIDWLTEKMRSRNLVVSSRHGDKDQIERDDTMKEFRIGSTQVLITTVLSARITDVQKVSVVINYDFPNNREDYIDRVGRKCVTVNFVTDEDRVMLRYITCGTKVFAIMSNGVRPC
ncbi:unnamed protein product [Rotaria socialis]|uniref:RNA helicase n=1 Tax=Rotaria socialis TaxID=392032 RepID=A0A818EHI2_9BILA|nr:unnamed protein product [Rotaria socialis]